MLLLRIFLILVLGLSFKTTIAFDEIENPTTVRFQTEQPLLITKKKDNRQRGECYDSPSLWALNICESNTFCYVTPEEVSLWLYEKEQHSGWFQVKIENSKTLETTEFGWKMSKKPLVWPIVSVPISSGAAYFITLKKRREVVVSEEIFLYQISADLPQKKKMLQMEQKGCISQVNMLQKQDKS